MMMSKDDLALPHPSDSLDQGKVRSALAPKSETGRGVILFAVFVCFAITLRDRTTYVSNFARADKLWFQHRVCLVDIDPQKRVKSAPCRQIMLPESVTFSFTTHFPLVELPLQAG